MFCSNCGKKIDDDAFFCGYCGKPTSGTSGASATGKSLEETAKLVVQEPTGKGPERPPSMKTENGASQGGFKAFEQETKNSSNKNIIIAVLVGVLVVVLIGGGTAFAVFAKPFESQPGSSPVISQDQNTSDNGKQTDETDANNSASNKEEREAPKSDKNIDSFTELENMSYVLPYSNSRLITQRDLAYFSDFELYIARNEIYARLGRGFQNQDLQDYFNRKSWYVKKYSPEEFDAKVTMNDIERDNALTIRKEEERRGSRYL